MYLASIDFGILATSTHLAFFAPLLLALLVLAPTLRLGFVGQFRRARVISEPVGTFRVARDGRSYILVGRTCHFGRRGESETSLRARLSL